MTFDMPQMLTIVGLLLTLAVQSWAVIQYLQGLNVQSSRELHERINRVRDEYVRRHDYDRDLERINTELAAIRQEVKDGVSHLSGRIDVLITAVRSTSA